MSHDTLVKESKFKFVSIIFWGKYGIKCIINLQLKSNPAFSYKDDEPGPYLGQPAIRMKCTFFFTETDLTHFIDDIGLNTRWYKLMNLRTSIR